MAIFIAYKISPHHLTDIVWVVLCFFMFAIVGIGQGATTVLQSTMIADCVDYEDYKNNRRPDALFFSGQTFLVKLQSGIATIICGIAYTIVKFSDTRVAEINAFIEAGGTPRLSNDYCSFLMVIFLIVSIPPEMGSILTVLPTCKYELNDDEHTKIMGILNERRHQNQLEIEPIGENVVESDSCLDEENNTESVQNDEIINDESCIASDSVDLTENQSLDSEETEEQTSDGEVTENQPSNVEDNEEDSSNEEGNK